jgi:hypothetical protein
MAQVRGQMLEAARRVVKTGALDYTGYSSLLHLPFPCYRQQGKRVRNAFGCACGS